MSGPSSVRIREVGPRDGLQVEEPVAVESRVTLIEALIDAGLREIEAVSFVSEKAVPSMASASEVMGRLRRRGDVRIYALVPNLRGAERAAEADVDALTVTVSVSQEYNRRNVRMTIDESLTEVERIAGLASELEIDAVVSCAFGSPYEGDIAPREVRTLADRLMEVGATSVTFADTTGMATPARIDALLDEVGIDVGLHLHESRGTALVNAYRAWQRGIARFDSSIGGLGGSPFAKGSAGNLATEDLVYVLGDLDVDTGVDLERLLRVSDQVAGMIGHDVPSRLSAAGLRDTAGPTKGN